MARSRAAAMAGAVAGTPGDLTTARTRSRSARPSVPAWSSTPAWKVDVAQALGGCGVDRYDLLAAGVQQGCGGLAGAGEADDEVGTGREWWARGHRARTVVAGAVGWRGALVALSALRGRGA